MFVTNKDLILPAMQKAYAVGAFNISNLESLSAVVEAAIEEKSPAIVAVTPSSIKYAGLTYIGKMVRTAAKFTPVPMSLHLDHGKDMETVSKCINTGFTSVMIDGSHLKLEGNIALTKRIVDLAHPKSVSVEAELGRLTSIEESAGKEKEAILTDPDAAKTFVDHTGVDALAVAIGTSHGAYKFKGKPNLDFERLKLIREKISIPLVLHGASSVPSWIIEKAIKYGAELGGAKGIPEEHIKEAIAMGIAKIGAPGSTAAIAMLNDAVKKGGLFASHSVGGLSGAFIPVCEDSALARAVARRTLTLEKLEAMTSVCSVGLDMIAVPGNIDADTLCAIIADEVAIGVINNKTTAVRIIPVPGKKAGHKAVFGGLFGQSAILPVNNPGAATAFVRQGGRIPAPLSSLKN